MFDYFSIDILFGQNWHYMIPFHKYYFNFFYDLHMPLIMYPKCHYIKVYLKIGYYIFLNYLQIPLTKNTKPTIFIAPNAFKSLKLT